VLLLFRAFCIGIGRTDRHGGDRERRAAFKPPEAVNAATTLTAAILLAILFMGSPSSPS
jgi:hypothetical protein